MKLMEPNGYGNGDGCGYGKGYGNGYGNGNGEGDGCGRIVKPKLNPDHMLLCLALQLHMSKTRVK